MASQRKDLGVALIAALLLVLTVSYLTQCSSARPPSTPEAASTSEAAAPASKAEETEEERERRPKSIHEFAAEEDREEREKLKSISRALKTIAADPEMRRTYGFKP